MIILAHRGFWRSDDEKNSEVAFRRAFENGFGVETDLRDFQGDLVISHDIPAGDPMTAQEFFEIYCEYEIRPMLALNIKSDGLQQKLKELLHKFKIENYFCFDMSIPDTLGYIKNGLNIYSRSSEYEREFPFYDNSEGVWLDCFNSDCITTEQIKSHIEKGKIPCIVSSELHKREYEEAWIEYNKLDKNTKSDSIMLCTDYPHKAEEFFNG